MKRLSLTLLFISAILLLSITFFISNSFAAPKMSGSSGPVRISDLSPYTPGCNADDTDVGVAYVNSETEPHIAVNPTDGDNMIAAWHQDRWNSAPAGSNILCMLPDTGERYLSTPLFDGVGIEMDEDEQAFSKSTPSCQF